MVKNSKYLLTLSLMLLTSGLWAQMSNNKFSPLYRDIEISRVTLENFLKKWDGDPLLNSIKEASGAYAEGKGVNFKIKAPNSRIFLDGRIAWSNNDKVLMDTFYHEEIIRLQKDRLKQSIALFLKDFSSYLPEVKSTEEVVFTFEVQDPETKKDEKQENSPKQGLRTYQIAFAIQGSDLNTINTTELPLNEIENRIKVTTK